MSDDRSDPTPVMQPPTLPPGPAEADERPTLPPSPTASFNVSGTPTQERRLEPATLPAIPGYEILEELGRGGMGVVYKARQLGLNRLVALKMILSGGFAGEADRARFRTEAEAIARLQHPNIVQIHEIGEWRGEGVSAPVPYFSLEYCGGGSLAQKLNGTPLPPNEAARIVETLARAMQAAHDKGVIHRDLKPANVLLSRRASSLACPTEEDKQGCLSYELKITDFGLAKKLDDVGQTATGAVMGTPSYMAPEQAGMASPGREPGDPRIGPAADIYALGAILYELLTGRPPFKGPTPLDTILQVVSDEPVPPRQLQSKTPKDLETICLKCLNKEPHKRYASAEALADDLRRFQAGEPILARPVGRLEKAAKWVRRNPVVAGSLAGVLLALLAGTVVSWYFALDAGKQAEKARKKEADALAAKSDLEKANEELEITFARSLLKPLGLQPGPLSDPELDALWELAESGSDSLRIRFVEEAIRSPVSARQLRIRAEPALYAALGVDENKRARVISLLYTRLRDPKLQLEHGVDLNLLLAAIADDPIVAADPLLVAMEKTTDANKLQTLAEGIAKVFAKLRPLDSGEFWRIAEVLLMETKAEKNEAWARAVLAVAACKQPKGAAEYVASAMSGTDDSAALQELVQGLEAVVSRMGRNEVDEMPATFLLQRMADDSPPEVLRILGQALAALATRMEPEQAGAACAQASATLSQAMAKTTNSSGLSALAFGLNALAARMEPEQAAAVCAQPATALSQAVAKTTDSSELATLVPGLEALAGRMRTKEAGLAIAALTQAMTKLTTPENQARLAKALGVLTRRMEPKEAAAILAQTIAKSSDTQTLQHWAHEVVALAARMGSQEAAESLSRAMSETINPFAFGILAEGLATVALRIDGKEAAAHCVRAAAVLSEKLEKAKDYWAGNYLGNGLVAVAARVEAKEAGQVAASLIQAMAKTSNPNALRELARGLAAVAARLEPKEAGAIFVQQMGKNTDPFALAVFAQGLPAVAARMKPEEAAQLCGQAAPILLQTMGKLKNRPILGDWGDLQGMGVLAQVLPGVADRMAPKEAIPLCSQAARILVQEMGDTTYLPGRGFLAKMLPALADRMPPPEADLLCAQAAAILTSTIVNDDDTLGHFSAAEGLAAVAIRLEAKEAAWAAAAVAQAIAKESDPSPRESMVQFYSTILIPLDPRESSRRTVAVLAAVGTQAGTSHPLAASVLLGPALTPLSCRFSTQQLVDLLKHPTCTGNVRRVVLGQLENRYRRKFADHWAFVSFAQEQKLGLDFTSPPRRFVLAAGGAKE